MGLKSTVKHIMNGMRHNTYLARYLRHSKMRLYPNGSKDQATFHVPSPRHINNMNRAPPQASPRAPCLKPVFFHPQRSCAATRPLAEDILPGTDFGDRGVVCTRTVPTSPTSLPLIMMGCRGEDLTVDDHDDVELSRRRRHLEHPTWIREQPPAKMRRKAV